MSSPVLAQEVGRFSIVTNQVTSLRPGASQAVPASVGARIVLDEKERTGEASAAQMMFGEGATVSVGARTNFAVTRQVVDEATGASASALDLLAGKVRVFVSRFLSGRSEVRVTTPTTVVGIKGSEAVIEVLEDGTTRVAFLRGNGRVRARSERAAWRDMTAGQKVEIRSGVTEAPIPVPLAPGDEEKLVAETRPVPDQGREKPKGRTDVARAASSGTTAKPASGGTVVPTCAPASGGSFAASSSPIAIPDPPIPAQSRKTGTTPGQ